MYDATALPTYTDEEITSLDCAALLAMMSGDEHRVRRNVIDACAARGEGMVAQLRGLLEDPRYWREGCQNGEWRRRLHAVMVLGLIPGDSAAVLLADFMRRMAEAEDEDLQDWLSGYWSKLWCCRWSATGRGCARRSILRSFAICAIRACPRSCGVVDRLTRIAPRARSWAAPSGAKRRSVQVWAWPIDSVHFMVQA